MPFAPEEERKIGDLTMLPSPELEPPVEAPSFINDIVPAFMRSENWVGAMLSRGRSPEMGVQNPDYDPFSKIAGTHLEPFAMEFADVDSDEDFDLVKYRIERGLADHEMTSRATGPQIAGMMFLGMLDPLVLVPFGQATKAARTGMLMRGLLTARAGAFGMAASEALLHAESDVRTFGESALNVAAAAVLSGVAGGGAELFARNPASRSALSTAAEASNVESLARAEAIVADDLGSLDEEMLGGAIAGGISAEDATAVSRASRTLVGSQKSSGSRAAKSAERRVWQQAVTGVPITVSAWRSRLPSRLAALTFEAEQRIGRTRMLGDGWYAARDPDVAAVYAGAGEIERYSVSLENPFVIESNSKAVGLGVSNEQLAEIRASGHDGIIVKPVDAGLGHHDRGGIELVVFDAPSIAGGAGAAVPPRAPYLPPPGSARARGPFMPQITPTVAPPPAPISTQNLRPVKAWKGLEKHLTKLSSLARILQQSSSEIARDAAVRMRAPPFFVETAEALKAAVYDRVIGGQAGLARYLQDSRAQWVEYRFGRAEKALDKDVWKVQLQEGITGRRGDPARMTFREFREEIGIAADAGGVHAIPQVAKAAKSLKDNVFDPTLDRGITVGAFDAAVKTAKPLGATGFFPRMWVQSRVKEFGNDLSQRIMQDAQLRDPTLTPDKARELTADTIDRISGINPDRIDMDEFHATIAKSTKHRGLPIANVLVNDFLEKDADKVARAYVHSVLPQIEMRAEFGEEGISGVLKKVNEEYQARLANAADGPERKALEAERDQTLEDLQVLHDQTMGTYGAAKNPDAWIARGSTFVRRYNFTTMGGGFGLNSVADIGNIAMARGIHDGFVVPINAMRADMGRFVIEAQKAGELANVFETVLNSRVNAVADISLEAEAHTLPEKAMGTLANSMSFVNLQAPWNQYSKSVVALTGMGAYRKMVNRARAGTLGRKTQLELDRAGIEWRGSGSMAERIANEMDAHGQDFNGLFLAETAQWTDREAARAFATALTRDVDRIIVSPGPGDLPNWLPTATGRLLGQFKQFQFATTMNIMLPNLQAADRNVINGIMVGVGAGAMVYMLRTLQNGKEPSMNPLVLIREGIDRSGALGVLFEPYNILERSLNVNPLGFAAPSSRYGQVSPTGAVFGPTVSTLQNAATALNSALTVHWTDADVRATRRLFTYQNVFYLDKGFDAIEAATRAVLTSERKQ